MKRRQSSVIRCTYNQRDDERKLQTVNTNEVTINIVIIIKNIAKIVVNINRITK